MSHLLGAVGMWIDEFGIDGLRLDAADCVDMDFFHQLRNYCKGRNPDFWLMGEIIHGDYNRWANPGALDSVTNYECRKGLYSSHNDKNYFEIAYSLNRQSGGNGGIYRSLCLYNFVDNHDVNRLASTLSNHSHLCNVYTLLYTMPGVPSLYYGSEWGAEGDKKNGDPSLRPSFAAPEWNELTDWISKLAEAKKGSDALNYGEFRSVVLTNKQCIFERKTNQERVLVAINADSEAYTAHFDAGCGMAEDLITGKPHDFGGGSELPPYSAYFWKCEH